MIDSPSAGSCLIPASLEPVQNSFLHREMGDSDGCPGNGDSAKPFPFSANEVVVEGGHLQQRSSQSHSQRAEGLITPTEPDYSLLYSKVMCIRS